MKLSPQYEGTKKTHLLISVHLHYHSKQRDYLLMAVKLYPSQTQQFSNHDITASVSSELHLDPEWIVQELRENSTRDCLSVISAEVGMQCLNTSISVVASTTYGVAVMTTFLSHIFKNSNHELIFSKIGCESLSWCSMAKVGKSFKYVYSWDKDTEAPITLCRGSIIKHVPLGNLTLYSVYATSHRIHSCGDLR